MTKWTNIYKFIFISMLFCAFKIQASGYVPYRKHKVEPSTFVYYNNNYDIKSSILSEIYNNNPRPCETCAGKFYILKNEVFGKNFSTVRDTVNNLLYIDKVICKDTKLSWNVKYPCTNHVHTIKFVNPEWEWENKDIQRRIKYFILEPMVIVVFCFLIFIIIAMFNSKDPRKIINKYTSPFIIGGIILLVYGVLMVAALSFPIKHVINESQYCISVVDADSTLTDTITYKIDSIYHNNK